MTTYIGNCQGLIDWNEVICSLENQQPAYVGPRHDVGDNVVGVNEVAIPLREAGYKTIPEGGNLGWDMFLPDKNFDRQIIQTFIDWVGLDGYTNAWISRVNPGNMAAWHWDVTDDEATLTDKEWSRYHVHMTAPQHGHVFILEDQCLYGRAQGDTFKWPDRKSWHAGANCGLVPKYQFNIWG